MTGCRNPPALLCFVAANQKTPLCPPMFQGKNRLHPFLGRPWDFWRLPHLPAATELPSLFLLSSQKTSILSVRTAWAPEQSDLPLSLLLPVFIMFGADSDSSISHFFQKHNNIITLFISPFLSPVPPRYLPLLHLEIMVSFSLVMIVTYLCICIMPRRMNTTCSVC